MTEPERRNYYIDEQLSYAVDYLATAHARIKERLEGMAATRLGVLSLEQFPGPLQELATSIFEQLDTAQASGPEGTYAASIRQMSEDEASSLASDILILRYRHERYWRDQEQGR